jgi:hypothetical protein
MAYRKKTAEEKAALRREKQYESDLELQSAVDTFFAEHTGVSLNEFALAQALGVTSRLLRKWAKDDEHKDRQFLIQSAYDRLTDAVITDEEWNGKFRQQQNKQILESPIFAGYNTKVDVKQDATLRLKFGEGADEQCAE